jgi:ankyrin repeat protein
MQWSLAQNWEAQSASNVTPLHLASHNGNIGGLRVLLEYGTQVHIRDNEGLTSLRRVLPHLGQDVGDVFYSILPTLLWT